MENIYKILDDIIEIIDDFKNDVFELKNCLNIQIKDMQINKLNEFNNKLKIFLMKKSEQISKIKNIENEINESINKLNETKNEKNMIELIYEIENNGKYNILGDEFVEKNKNKGYLIVNGIQIYEIKRKIYLKRGINIVQIIFTEKITDFSHMFDCINLLKDISGLKNLDVQIQIHLKECSLNVKN